VLTFFFAFDVQAQERIYSTVDAQGRVQVIKGDATESKQSIVAEPQNKSQPLVEKKPVYKYELEGEEYIDAEIAEKKQAEQNAKKNRFYYVPTGALGEKVLESEQSAGASPVKKAPEIIKPLLKLSSEYQKLSKEWLLLKQQQLSSYCEHQKSLKPIRAFKESNPLWIEKADFVGSQPDKILMLDNSTSVEATVAISNFSNSHQNPKFYLPMIVFLNEQGCVLEGAWRYWSQAKPANDNQYSSVEGLLIIPVSTKYILLYPPDKDLKANLPLQNYGALLIEK